MAHFAPDRPDSAAARAGAIPRCAGLWDWADRPGQRTGRCRQPDRDFSLRSSAIAPRDRAMAALGYGFQRQARRAVVYGDPSRLRVAAGGLCRDGDFRLALDLGGGAALLGNLAALGSAFGFAVFTVALRWGRSGDMLPAVFLSGIFAIFITSSICLLSGLSFKISVNDSSIAMGMGVFQVGAGLVLYTLGSKTLPAAELTLLSLAEVLLGPLWVYLFLNEVATLNTLLGGLVLLLAIAGNAISGARRKPPPITTP